MEKVFHLCSRSYKDALNLIKSLIAISQKGKYFLHALSQKRLCAQRILSKGENASYPCTFCHYRFSFINKTVLFLRCFPLSKISFDQFKLFNPLSTLEPDLFRKPQSSSVFHHINALLPSPPLRFSFVEPKLHSSVHTPRAGPSADPMTR